jgi:alkanesulfonate monooxygenase SsuD/methylene tetrahydromethanopterin reductase-like flavin-dependent oxidoreductase (luciferase family)
MRFGLSIPPFTDPAVVVDLAVQADRAGWDGVFLWDHLHFRREDRLDVHDPWVLLGAIAQATTHVRLGTMVTPLARRRPQVVAKQVVTLDHLSGGRAVLGVGLGEPPGDEFEAFGDPGDARVRARRLDESLAAIDLLWRAEAVRYHGELVHLDAELHPGPVQRPRPPIWVAGVWPHRRPLARAAQWDGVVPLDPNDLCPPARVAEVVAVVGQHRDDLTGFDVVAMWAPGAAVAEYEEAGATWLIDSVWPAGDWVSDLRAVASAPPPR